MKQKSYYKILQVDASAEPEVIAAAYKRLAQKYHPDTNSSPAANLRMQEINKAYAILRNADARTQHDQELLSSSAVVDLQTEAAEQRRREEAEATRRQAAYVQQQQAQAIIAHRRHILIFTGLLCIIFINVTVTTIAIIQPKITRSSQNVVGIWGGEWTDNTGYVYNCRIKIKIDSDNDVAGSITWTLKDSPRRDEQLKIGRQATAYVKGTFNPKHRLVTMGSYRQDDPYDVVDVNEYRLYLLADNSTMSGETFNDGVWEGNLSATRQE